MQTRRNVLLNLIVVGFLTGELGFFAMLQKASHISRQPQGKPGLASTMFFCPLMRIYYVALQQFPLACAAAVHLEPQNKTDELQDKTAQPPAKKHCK